MRQAYAQQRYQELTGWPAPAAGGPARTALTPTQQVQDAAARRTIGQELGHTQARSTVGVLGG